MSKSTSEKSPRHEGGTDLDEIKQQIEYFFADDIIQSLHVGPMSLRPHYEREGLIAIASETNLNGFVGVDLFVTFPNLALLTQDTSVIVRAVENSDYLILSDDKKQIRVLPTMKVPPPEELYPVNPTFEDVSFTNVIKTRRFISARKLFKRRPHNLNTFTQMDVLRKANTSRKMGLVIKLMSQYSGASIYNLLRHASDVNPSYVLLLWTIFPKLLFMHEDIIHEPTIFQEAYDICGPNWWQEVLKRLQQRVGQNHRADEGRVTEYNVNTWMPHGDICTIRGVDAAGARVLAKALCSEKIMVIHDKIDCVWVKDVTCSGPSMSNIPRTAFRVLPRPPTTGQGNGHHTALLKHSETEEGVVVDDNDSTRDLSIEELEYLNGLDPLVLDRTYIHWEYYCRDLLESMQRLGGSLVDDVVELRDVVYPMVQREACIIHGVDAAGARLLAHALCTETIILVHNIVSSILWIKDITGIDQTSTIASTDMTTVTYMVLPRRPGSTLPSMRRMRDLTSRELAYLHRLRWRDRRPAILVAARYRSGQHFNVLKIVAHFL